MRNFLLRLFSRIRRLMAAVFRRKGDAGFDDPINDDDVFVDYYGCPNSNRAQKLQLQRRRHH